MEVAVFVNNVLYPQFINITDAFGGFQIDFRIPYSFDVYSVPGYKVQVNVTDPSKGKVKKENFLIIFANATSYFDINYVESPNIPGETFSVDGYLRDDTGSGIPNAQINYQWYNDSNIWPINSFFTSSIDGSFIEGLLIPTDAFSDAINLNLSYSGYFPYINYTKKAISQIKLFRNITCIWNTVANATMGDQIIISGQLVSKSNSSFKIFDRTIRIFYDGNYISIMTTDINGEFTYNFTVQSGIGNKAILIDLMNTAGLVLYSETYINITALITPLPTPDPTPVPFLDFFMVFIPILIAVIGVLIGYGIYYYKKQDKLSKVVDLPLESKIINLKILKDTGRLEESLSYLFNAIYMDLINAKFGRTRSDNETIRDFAIISVKNLKLSPTTIYPFIQKVEEIIYAKPFQITDKEFYNTINLFSPIYFELTGYNFVLNF